MERVTGKELVQRIRTLEEANRLLQQQLQSATRAMGDFNLRSERVSLEFRMGF